MKFTYTKDTDLPVSCYKIEVSYEHGDADITTNCTFTRSDEPALLQFVDRFLKCRAAVSDNRFYGTELDDDIIELLEELGERDRMAQGVSDYYADMGINSITYYDPHGARFAVTIDNE